MVKNLCVVEYLKKILCIYLLHVYKSIGCWEEDVQQVVLKYLVIGNTEIRLDLIRTMQEGKNVQYVDKVSCH